MQHVRYLTSAALVGLIAAVSVLAQPKGPASPPLNLAVAKLGQTATLEAVPFAVAWDEDKGLLLVGGADHLVRVWARNQDKALLAADAKVVTLKGHPSPVTAVTAATGLYASGSSDGTVLVWKLPADKPAFSLNAGTPVRALDLSGDGKVLASAGDDGAVQLWDPATGKAVRKLTGPTDWLLTVAFSADGKTVSAGGQDGKLWAWEVGSGKKLLEVVAQPPPPAKTEPRTNVVQSLVYSPDGKMIYLGGTDGKVHQFQAGDGKLVRSLSGHTGTVTTLAYHAGYATLASGSKDRTIRLWNPNTGAALKTLEGHTAWVEGARFLDKGTRLVSVGADRTVRVWDLTNPPAPKK